MRAKSLRPGMRIGRISELRGRLQWDLAPCTGSVPICLNGCIWVASRNQVAAVGYREVEIGPGLEAQLGGATSEKSRRVMRYRA
jgi:hypothetical protein